MNFKKDQGIIKKWHICIPFFDICSASAYIPITLKVAIPSTRIHILHAQYNINNIYVILIHSNSFKGK